MEGLRSTPRLSTRYALAGVTALVVALGALAPGAGDPRATAVEQAGATQEPPAQDGAGSTADAAPSPGEVRPRITPATEPLGPVTAAPVPDRGAVSGQISDELDSTWLGGTTRRAVAIRDALTGEPLGDRYSSRLVTPASTTKLLAAAAVVTGLPGNHTFTTRVVAGADPGEVVLVAGGDMLLADGDGDPEAVAGHAGIADLAAQTAASLGSAQGSGEAPEGPVRVSLDLTYVEGPHAMPTWIDRWLEEGYAGRIVQIGRSVDRARPFNPSPRAPEQQVARVFREALAEEGVDVEGAGDDDARAAEVQVADDARELATVESAAARDVLALALATSDNAMVEQLARQAAVADGEAADQESVTAWIRRTMVEDYGLDMTGVRITDASGLSDGTLIPVAAVADVLVAGADGSHPRLQEVLAAGGLPIAGYTGTLATRFHLDVHDPAVGNARAKTGTLPGVSSLAGTVVTRDGRLLVYALTADDIDQGAAAIEAASVLDEVVADLARCGC
ncbi:D-alanyl-D-alanine carboxypeptidase/D-alanyl-D-alanine-endopeptidase [uncultured Serinicoccus sp.]|uniref:D-alanyl-D-alanine carboxypeptidase/D-alanyl-D-alanine-endopeptidase n=1 Tax=uncultured Serinicoccus sp. TaxID=735514 RepID=UPI00260635F5|nr:D-alanyl-D-alanine carboxypeptidase [uncultured Serinicoccus sp.]